MTKFTKDLKPIFVDNKDLIRIVSSDVGGYVVPANPKKLFFFIFIYKK